MNTPRQICDADLNAYIDGELDDAARLEVENWLATHPEDLARINNFQRQNAQLRELFNPVAEEAVPAEMLAIFAETDKQYKRPIWRQIAAAIALLVMGGGIGWSVRGLQPQDQMVAVAPSYVERAVGAHFIYTSEVLHPVEVEASKEDHLIAWLSKRLGNPLKTPQLGGLGYFLVGGRLLEESGQPAAQFMYENKAGRRVTIYVRTNQGKDTAFKFYDKGDLSAFYWVDAPFAYALTGEMPRAELMKIARVVYRGLSS